MTASDSLFDSKGGFSGSVYPMKTAEVEDLRLRDVAMATTFWLPIGYSFGFVIAIAYLNWTMTTVSLKTKQTKNIIDERNMFLSATFPYRDRNSCYLHVQPLWQPIM